MKKKYLIFIEIISLLFICLTGFVGCNKTVKYDLNFIVENEVYATITTAGNEIVTMPENPTKEYYTFDGWYWDNGTWERPFTINSILNEPLQNNMAVFAHFIANDYNINFDTDGGILAEEVNKFNVDELPYTLPEPTKDGYSFDGWIDLSNNQAITKITASDIREYNLKAEWTSKSIANVVFEDATYVYDGTEKTIVATNYSQNVSVEYSLNTLTNVGTINVTASFYLKGEKIGAKTAKLTITKADYDMSGISFNDYTTTYDGEEKVLVIKGNLPDDVRVEYSSNTLTNAGSVVVTATFTGTDTINYNLIPSKTATLTIEKANYNMSGITFFDDSFVYDGTSKSIFINGTLPQGVTVSYTGNAKINAGEYEVIAKFSGNTRNYNLIENKTAYLYINKADYDISGISFENACFEYDTTIKRLTITGTLPDGVSVRYTNNDKINVGEYVVTATFTGNRNYNDISDMSATLTINKATYEDILFEDVEFTYNGRVPTVKIGNNLPDEITVSYSGEISKDVGNYEYTAKFTVNNNYNTIKDKTINVSIKKADITFTAENKTSIYADEIKPLTYKVTGTNYDNIVPTLEKEEGIDVGVYEIKIFATHSNYNISLENGIYTITKATFDSSKVVFNDASYIYDGTEKTLEITSILPNDISVEYSSNKLTNVGSIEVLASFIYNTKNYNEIPNIVATLTINKATYNLNSVKFNNASYVYDGAEKVIEISGNLPDGVVVYYENNTLMNVGSITAKAIFVGNDTDNYNLIPDRTATLVITKATYNMDNVCFSNRTYTYDGTQKTLEITGLLPSGVIVEYTQNKLTNAGSIEVTATFTGDSNNYYAIQSKKATLTIEKANYDMSSISFENATYNYDGTERTIEITGTLPTGVSVNYTNNKRTNAGTSNAIAKFSGDSTNYNTISNMTAILTIEKISYNMSNVSFENKTYIYDKSTKSILITGSLPYGVTVNYIGNEQIIAGSYIVIAKFTGDNTNYNSIPDMTATLNIEKATPIVTPYYNGNVTTDSQVELLYSEQINGSLALDNNQTLVIGVKNYNWTFVPQDITNYNFATGTISITVKAKVNFVSDDIIISTQLVEKNGYATEPETIPTKGDNGGYSFTFSHWSDKQNGAEFNYDTQIENNLNLYAVYDSSIIEYTITLNLDNGLICDYPKKYTIVSNEIVLPQPEKEDYEFIGWSGSNGNNPELNVVIPTGSIGNKNYIANYNSKIFYISNNTIVGITDYGKTKTEITIPDYITTISDNAFSYCTNLEVVTIPNSVQNIGSGIFKSCYHLTKLSLPFVGDKQHTPTDSYQYPFGYIFGTDNYSGGMETQQNYIEDISSGSTETKYYIPLSLEDVVITGSTYIPYGAFYDCSNLINIKISNNISNIGDYAFYNCNNLVNIAIPDNVTNIGEYAFVGCDKLNYNEYANGYYLGNDNNRYIILVKAKNQNIEFCNIHYSTKFIHTNAFSDCTKIGSIIIPENVSKISINTFSGCNNLTSITMPNNITSICSSAFSNCNSLININIPNSIANIGDYAFNNCFNLANITIPNGVETIDNNTFSNCYSLTSIIIPDSVTSIGENSFSSCNSLTDITMSDGVINIGNSAFSGCSSLTDITVPNSVTTIGDSAFSGCSSLTKISIPFVGKKVNTPENTYQYPFGYIFGKDSYTGGTEINQYYKYNGSSYEIKYYFPSSLKEVVITGSSYITYGAFSGCYNLTSIIIPNTIISIGADAFAGCNKLNYNEYSNGCYLGNSDNKYLILVKAKNKNIEFCNIHYSTKFICSSAFEDCAQITSILIPDNITTIYESTFYGCASLNSVTISKNVTSIGSHAFRDCSSLTSITIPNSVTRIEGCAFYKCTSLKSITFEDNSQLTSIYSSAFGYCSSLTSITIPNSVTSIYSSAFRDCSSLTSITIPNSVTSISSDAFQGCSSLTRINFQGTKAQWNKIDKRSGWWDSGTGKYTIYCTDGNITK